MSTIVAVQKGDSAAIAWDTMSSRGSTRCVNSMGPPKVIPVGSSYLGCVGLTVYLNVLDHRLGNEEIPLLGDSRSVFEFFLGFWQVLREHYHFVNDQADSDDPSPFADLDAEFLVVNSSGLFLVKEILSVSQFGRYCAIGSGAPHAEGALSVLYDIENDAALIARKAVESALMFDAASGGDIEVREVQCT